MMIQKIIRHAFSSAATMNGGWNNGVLGYQDAGTDVTTIGLSYDLGGINLGYTMYTSTHGWYRN